MNPTVQHAQATGASALDLLLTRASDLQACIKCGIEALPRTASSAGELSRFLGLDRSSVWRIWRAVYSESAAEGGAALCGEASLRRFADALVQNGASAQFVRNFDQCQARFAETACAAFGDLATARLALSRASPRAFMGDGKYGAAMFDSARLRQGVQAAATLRVTARERSQFENLVDSMQLRHFERLMTFDSAATHLLQRRQFLAAGTDKERPRAMAIAPEPLDPREPMGEDHAVSFIHHATRLNGRNVSKVRRDRMTIETRVSGGTCGRAGESDICMGERVTAHEPVFPYTQFVAVSAEQLIPCELLVIEFYFEHHEYLAGLRPEPRVFDMLHADGGFPGFPVPIGQTDMSVEHYPPGAKRPKIQEIANYGAALDAVEHTMTRGLQQLHLFRWRVPYPVVDAHYALCAGAVEPRLQTPAH